MWLYSLTLKGAGRKSWYVNFSLHEAVVTLGPSILTLSQGSLTPTMAHAASRVHWMTTVDHSCVLGPHTWLRQRDRDAICTFGDGMCKSNLLHSQNYIQLTDWSMGKVAGGKLFSGQVLYNMWASHFCPGWQRHVQHEVHPSAPVFVPMTVY